MRVNISDGKAVGDVKLTERNRDLSYDEAVRMNKGRCLQRKKVIKC